MGSEDKIMQYFIVAVDHIVFAAAPGNLPFVEQNNVFPDFHHGFMSCVLMTVVMLLSLVMSLMSSSMTRAVLGSRPEFVPQNRYLVSTQWRGAMPHALLHTAAQFGGEFAVGIGQTHSIEAIIHPVQFFFGSHVGKHIQWESARFLLP